MIHEAIADYFIANHRCCSTRQTEVFYRISPEKDAVYEVVKLIDGIPLFLEPHIDRFRHSSRQSGHPLCKEVIDILDEIATLVKKNLISSTNVKMVWGRAEGEDLFLTYFIRTEYPGPDAYARGVQTILFAGERETPTIKTLKGSFRSQVRQALAEQDAWEALLVDKSGFITEGSRSNIFFVKDGNYYTPPAGTVLTGVTRQKVMELLNRLGVTVFERPLHRDELADIEGAFITGTTVDVLPVAAIGTQHVDSVNALCVRRVIDAYEKEMRNYIHEWKDREKDRRIIC